MRYIDSLSGCSAPTQTHTQTHLDFRSRSRTSAARCSSITLVMVIRRTKCVLLTRSNMGNRTELKGTQKRDKQSKANYPEQEHGSWMQGSVFDPEKSHQLYIFHPCIQMRPLFTSGAASFDLDSYIYSKLRPYDYCDLERRIKTLNSEGRKQTWQSFRGILLSRKALCAITLMQRLCQKLRQSSYLCPQL